MEPQNVVTPKSQISTQPVHIGCLHRPHHSLCSQRRAGHGQGCVPGVCLSGLHTASTCRKEVLLRACLLHLPERKVEAEEMQVDRAPSRVRESSHALTARTNHLFGLPMQAAGCTHSAPVQASGSVWWPILAPEQRVSDPSPLLCAPAVTRVGMVLQ